MLRKKILHLMPEEKIVPQLVYNFNLVNSENIFVFFKKDICYFKDSNEQILVSNLVLNDLIKREEIQGVIVHGLYPYFAKLICGLTEEIRIAWFVWGFDIYNRSRTKVTLYAPQTKSLVLNGMHLVEHIKSYKFLRQLLYFITRKEDFEKYIENSYKRITYFCSYIFEDFEFFNAYFDHNTTFFEAPFCSIEQYLAGNTSLKINGNAINIIIGNSNSPENNHLDVFCKLQCFKLGLPIVYVPLSYGNDLKYKDEVLREGEEILGQRFRPMLDFVDREIYLRILQGCSTAIFYHYRQQAMGNIIALLYMGVRIYLSQKNPIYKYFVRHGLVVYDFDSHFEKFTNQRMAQDDVDNNRRILSELFSVERIKNSLTALIKAL